jgi:hypothetical protein
VWFSTHQEYDFDTLESDFRSESMISTLNTQNFDTYKCDYDTQDRDLETQGVFITRRVWSSTQKCDFNAHDSYECN